MATNKAEMIQKVVDFVSKNPNSEVSAIKDHLGGNYQSVRKLVLAALESKLIERKKKNETGVVIYVYFVPVPAAASQVEAEQIVPVAQGKSEPAFVEVDPVAASVANIASSGDFKAFVDLIAKPVSVVVAEAVLPAITARTTELVVQKVLADLPSQVVIDLINRLRTLEIGPVIETTKSLVTELARPKKIRVCISGAKTDDEAKLRKEFESEFTLDFVPSDDLNGILRSADFADHIILLTGRPNAETANSHLKLKGKTPILVSGGFKEISDRLTDLYLETPEA
jgi:hypothetical protein